MHSPLLAAASPCRKAWRAGCAMPRHAHLQAYVSYKVIAKNRRAGTRSEVIRRFRDFVWLQQRLRSQYRGAAGRRAGAGKAVTRCKGRAAPTWGPAIPTCAVAAVEGALAAPSVSAGPACSTSQPTPAH